ncbi:hypothetical protein [Candidatus Nitrosocosmicus franklandus]|uniref:Uncharacterized protein n=1 Tax=Candidatus Nitrosocosmicus franklandianus TaxID=1798806 RepID=A0A484IBK7_9ARCH|nr:hypothetical protein [Candidatus Nitrosocosmicus franklandus]VFJ14695.1 protein of unknown function [Candidatus Nitrosocosmicus franklandus]
MITEPYSYETNGPLVNVGNITNKGIMMTLPLSNNLVKGQGQGILSTLDGNESATYTFQFIGSLKDKTHPPHGNWFFTLILQANWHF